MKESGCPVDSSSSNEREGTRGQRRGDHLLSDICRYLEVAPDGSAGRSPGGRTSSSRENVELGLEIEINESLKKVLTAPDGGSDDLLDVTIIRPSESDVAHETTVALNKDEVRDFITLVEQHRQNKLRGSAKPKKSNNKRCKEREKTPPPSGGRRAEAKPASDENSKGASGVRSQRAEKPGTPCVCQHCGIMGVLVQSHRTHGNDLRQSEEEKRSSREEEKRKRRDKSADRQRDQKEPRETKEIRDAKNQRVVETASTKSTHQVELLREINTRIKDLEKRIAAQEESAVPRDYLKHVLHKVLTQYKVQTEQQKSHNVRNAGTQYVVETKENYPSHNKKETKGRHYQVHTLLHTPTAPGIQSRFDTGEPSSTSHNSYTQEAVNINPALKQKKELLYFWGEEVVKPGCDLKTKIMDLLEEKIGKPENSLTESLKPLPQSRIPIALPEKLPKAEHQPEIRVERDDKLLFLGKMDEIPPCNIDDYVQRSKTPELIRPLTDKNFIQQSKLPVNTASTVVPQSLRPDSRCRQRNAIPGRGTKNSYRNASNPPKSQYPFDPKRTLDDSTFRKNIEAHKEKLKEKPKIDDMFFCNFASPSVTTESKASIEYVLQKMKNDTLPGAGAIRRNERLIEDAFGMNQYAKVAGTIIRENMTSRGFRGRNPTHDTNDDILSIPVDVTYINPKITHWSEESTASEDKYMKYMRPSDKKETLPVETKESLIYKLEFLKNLAKHKSADQSKVLNKIWTQAKRTAKSKNDAVFIKIPFKSVNTIEPRNNVIEMQLTLEQLETVVKSVKVNGSASKIANYRSSSEMDVGQRRHEEIRRANMEVLNKRRHLSAKTDRNKK